MYVAIAVLFGLMTPLAGNLPAAAALPAPPEAELLINGSFETADFTGWSTDDMASPFFSLGVYDDFEFLPLRSCTAHLGERSDPSAVLWPRND